MPIRIRRILNSRFVPLATVCLTVAAALVASPASAAPGPSREVDATFRNGVRFVGDLRVGPLSSPRAVSTLADVREVWGPERRLVHRSCTASWGTGVRLLFTSFGGPSACSARFLQVATVTGPHWVVNVGQQGYRIGLPRRQLPPGARRVHGGFQLATMPFPGVGGRTATVIAHVNGRTQRVDRFVLFLGHAGD